MIDPRAPDYASTPASPDRARFGYAPRDPHAPPAVTVVTPFYNTGPEFHETARTVLGQSLQQWEWLIVNDGSDDPRALAILDAYRGGDPRIRVVDHPANRGLPAARNTGYALARAPLVLQLDSDDLLEPTAAEVWAWHLATHHAAAFVKGYSVHFGAAQHLWARGFGEPDAFRSENLVDPVCLVRAAAHRAAGGYDEAMRAGLEDWDFWLRCASAGLWGATLPLFLGWYRRRASHADRWGALRGDFTRRFAREARRRYPRLWSEGMPRLPRPAAEPLATPPVELPFDNLLARERPRALLLAPTFGDAARPALDTLAELVAAGCQVSVVSTSSVDVTLLPALTRITPDVFAPPVFLRPADLPRFLRYLVRSRGISAVWVSGSVPGELIAPALRSGAPELVVAGPRRPGGLAGALRAALDNDDIPPPDEATATRLVTAAAEVARLELAREEAATVRPAPSRDSWATRGLRAAYYRAGSGIPWLRPARDWFVRRRLRP